MVTMIRLALLLAALASSLPVWTVAAANPIRFRIQHDTSALTFKATSRVVNAEGQFHRFGGEVTVDPKDLATARVTLTIDAASIDTGITRRDNHLRSKDFFDVDRFPSATFESLRTEPAGRRVTLVGRLTIHGVTREIKVPVEVEVSGEALVARGEFTINRSDYGMSYQSMLNPVGEAVAIGFTFRGTPVRGERTTRP